MMDFFFNMDWTDWLLINFAVSVPVAWVTCKAIKYGKRDDD